MNKKLFLVSGYTGGDPDNVNTIKAFTEELVGWDRIWIKTDNARPDQILNLVTDAMRLHGDKKSKNNLVLYDGLHNSLLRHNIPCDGLDVGCLKNKLIEVIRGYATPQEREMVDTLFTGSIWELLRIHTDSMMTKGSFIEIETPENIRKQIQYF